MLVTVSDDQKEFSLDIDKLKSVKMKTIRYSGLLFCKAQAYMISVTLSDSSNVLIFKEKENADKIYSYFQSKLPVPIHSKNYKTKKYLLGTSAITLKSSPDVTGNNSYEHSFNNEYHKDGPK